jgi:hypothetical protein
MKFVVSKGFHVTLLLISNMKMHMGIVMAMLLHAQHNIGLHIYWNIQIKVI